MTRIKNYRAYKMSRSILYQSAILTSKTIFKFLNFNQKGSREFGFTDSF